MRYRAFISYSHAEKAWARWLIRRLETYRVPALLVGQPGAHGPVPARLGAFFRDRDELTASSDLGATIREALAESEFLIVLCSPAAAASQWVNAEVQAFRDSGRADRVLAFVVDGDPGQSGPGGAFPPALVAPDASGKALEPLAADARRDADGRSRAFLKLVSSLLGIRFDQLARRDAQRKQRKLLMVAAASVAGMAIAIGLAITAYVARNDAQRRQAQAEDIVGFMLGDLRKKLTTVGRLDLMRTVDDKATAYFATLNPRDLTDQTLAEQARSLTGIGEVRLNEGNHDEAMAAFREAHARSTALYQRAPKDGQRLFDLAQAEYWIGFVAWQQGRLDDAGVWLTKYRDSAIKLAAMDRNNFDWQREVAYGHHNIAALDSSKGKYAEAEIAIREELSLYHIWLEDQPQNLQLRDEAATAASWMGSLMLHQGRLREAELYYQEQLDSYEDSLRVEPSNANRRSAKVESLILLSEAQALQGGIKEARQHLNQACAIALQLTKQDSSNNEWRTGLGTCLWWQSRLEGTRRASLAVEKAKRATKILRSAHRIEPNNELVISWLARAYQQQAQLSLDANNVAEAIEQINMGRSLLTPAWKERPTERLRLWLAWNHLLQGDAAHANGNQEAATQEWQTARTLLEPRDKKGTTPFVHLDPLVRTATALGATKDAKTLRARLDTAGYVPLVPFQTDVKIASR